MDRFLILSHARYLVVGCVVGMVFLLLALIRRGAKIYRSAFVTSVGAGLKQNFIVANPQALFSSSVFLTVVFGSLGYIATGPTGSAVATVVCVIAPGLAVRRLAARRTKRFIYQLPDALMALACALRAGSNLAKGLELLATRQPVPLSQEFMIVLAEYRVGCQLAKSLADMRRRIGAPELDLMNTAMNVSRRSGGNLAETLEALARTLQEKAHIEGKIDALTSMGRAQGWVVGLLPLFIGFVLYQQQPERMRLMFTQWYGWVVLAVVAAMMTMAAWMIRKIVRIDV
jgi:tight adherence protein B